MSDSLRPCGLQHTRLPCPSTTPESESEVAQSSPILCDPMDSSLLGSSVHGIFQAIAWIAVSFSRRSSQPRDWTRVSLIVDRRFTIWATREVNSCNLLKLISIVSVMPSKHLIFCHPLLLLPSIFPSIRVFSNESVLRIRCPKYWSSSFSIDPSNEYSGLISLRMDWLDLLAVQGTLKSLLQHHSSKASVLLHSAFFIVQLSHPCMNTGKP